MLLEIFNVSHGACALITCDDGKHIMIDCGQNRDEKWKPGDILVKRGIQAIELLVITNYDEDHVRGLPNLLDNVRVERLLRNKSVSPDDIDELKSEDGMGPGIARLVDMAREYNLPGVPIEYPGVEYETFHNSPETFEDENNLSLVLFLKLRGKTVLFPGDLENAGWRELLKNERFRKLLGSVDILVASHHGRENGICEEIFDECGCKPFWVVISDCEYKYDTQETVPYYRRQTKGGHFRGETRNVLTTRNDGAFTFEFDADGKWRAF